MKQMNTFSMENIKKISDPNWDFLVELMFMLRNREISLSDTNGDIYKAVVARMANKMLQSATNAEETMRLLKSLK